MQVLLLGLIEFPELAKRFVQTIACLIKITHKWDIQCNDWTILKKQAVENLSHLL